MKTLSTRTWAALTVVAVSGTLAAVGVVAARRFTSGEPPVVLARPGEETAWHQEPGTWELTAGSVDGESISVPAGSRVTLAVDGDMVGGTAACNGYGGDIRVEGAAVRIGPLSGTDMACAQAVLRAEEQFREGLPRVSTASREGDVLTLSGAGVSLRFALQAPVAIDDVVGHVWVLKTITDRGTSWSPVGKPTLRLLDDGTLSGSTGCRDLEGRYVVYGDGITTPELGADGECPADLQDQDNHVIFLLEGSFRARVEGDRLMLTSDGGPDAVYVRQSAAGS